MTTPSETGYASLCDEPRFQEPLRRCAAGELPPNVALMQILVEARAAGEAEHALTTALDRLEAGAEPAGGADRLRRVLELWRANPQAFAVVKAVLADVEHGGGAPSPEAGVAHWASLFDRLAKVSQEGSVALYALGNPSLLRAATAEVVARLRDWGCLGPDKAVLDLGCGNGRFEEALAPEVGTVTGLDVSGEMIAAARARCAGLRNVRFEHASGRDLSGFAAASFSLVLAVDSFPYLVQAGMELADRHVAEAARVLRPGGDCVILNFSYRGDPEADRRDVARLGREAGLIMLRQGTREFELWDGRAFHLRKPA